MQGNILRKIINVFFYLAFKNGKLFRLVHPMYEKHCTLLHGIEELKKLPFNFILCWIRGLILKALDELYQHRPSDLNDSFNLGLFLPFEMFDFVANVSL